MCENPAYGEDIHASKLSPMFLGIMKTQIFFPFRKAVSSKNKPLISIKIDVEAKSAQHQMADSFKTFSYIFIYLVLLCYIHSALI